MSALIDTIFKRLSSKVDDLLVIDTISNDRQVKFSEAQIDVSTVWDNHAVDVFVAKNGKTTSTTLDPGNEVVMNRVLDNLLVVLEKVGPNSLYKGLSSGKFTYQTIPDTNDSKIEQFSNEAPEIVNQAIDASIKTGAKRAAGILFFGSSTIALKSSAGPEGTFTHTYWEFNFRGLQEDTVSTGFGQNAGALPSTAAAAIIKAGEEAGTFSKQMIGATMGSAGQYDVVFGPGTGGQIFSALPRQANPLLVLLGQSGLGDRMGEQLAPEYVNITDEGPRPNAMVATPFDSEGCATQITPIFKEGRLVNFVHNTSSAKLMQAENTGNSFLAGFGFGGGSKILAPGSHTMVFSPGDHSLEELFEVRSSRPTLYITNSWYMRYTNSVEGIFSTIPRDGMFIVSPNGDFQPVKKLRLSDNLYRIMQNIKAVGKDLHQSKWWDEVNPPVILPHILVSDCRMSAATK